MYVCLLCNVCQVLNGMLLTLMDGDQTRRVLQHTCNFMSQVKFGLSSTYVGIPSGHRSQLWQLKHLWELKAKRLST